MEDFQGVEEKAFVKDEVDNVIKESIENTIQNAAYHHNKVAQWNSNIVEQCLKKLTGLNKPFKYIGSTTYKYDSKTMYVIVNVFGLTI
ncbi:Dynein light chain Tctex-type [Rhizophlyctis rosea]|uniref:Dynein light chain Tctex-type n=1 Tax=Rhizophlyctis rosea TaxID=64517 RepID=A0AAD5WZ13_9FUNG|nr:Dynein light chain Tctex-type [Rhizophlyctis rosea]